MLGRTDSRRRLLAILIMFAVAGASLVGRLAWWQVVRGADLAAEAHRQTTLREDQPSRRGTIYDRSGTVVLATSVDRYRLIGSPRGIDLAERQKTGQALVGLLGLEGQPAVDLVNKMTSERGYVVLTRGIDEPIAERAARRTRPSGRRSSASSTAMGRASTASSRSTSHNSPVSRRSSSPSAMRTAIPSPGRSWSNRPASPAPTSG